MVREIVGGEVEVPEGRWRAEIEDILAKAGFNQSSLTPTDINDFLNLMLPFLSWAHQRRKLPRGE